MSSRLLLIDGNALAHRAFHAIPALSTRDGRPTNALFGFIRMAQQIRQQAQPTHQLVVFDGGLPEERMKLLPEYKAQRPPMADQLAQQFSPIEDYLGVARTAFLRLPGQEADDVMATVTRRAVENEMSVWIATGDKDMFQLLGENVRLIAPSGEQMGPAEVEARTGVPPAAIVDWLALIGDSVDNIPGVPGIGPKTATKLLARFGSLPQILARLDEVDNLRWRQALEAHRDVLARNVQLLRLRTDLPVELDWETLRATEPDRSALAHFFECMELYSLAKALKPPPAEQGQFNFG